MRALSIHVGADTGGQAYRIAQGFHRHSDWAFNAMVRSQNYIAYPVDTHWTPRAIRELVPAADVLHLHNGFATMRFLTRYARPEQGLVTHHHGTAFRANPEQYLREARGYGALSMVSTMDLWALAPEAEWLPAPYDLDWLAGIRAQHYRDDGVLRIAHAPTEETIKSTKAITAAVNRLKDRYPVELVLISKKPWNECLRLKATADLFIDQCILGYGCNAIEAWGMGIPVIAGVDPARSRQLKPLFPGIEIADHTEDAMRERWGEQPFYAATEATLEQAIEAMITDPQLRATYAARGLAHAQRWHDDATVVRQLEGIYTRAASMPHTYPLAPSRPAQPLTPAVRRRAQRLPFRAA